MAEDNRPRGREKNVTGEGKGVKRRGEGLGTGKVGSGSGVPGQGPAKASGTTQGGGQRTQTRAGGSKLPLIVIILVLLFGGGGGALSGLFGGGGSTGNTSYTPAPSTQTQTQTQTQTGANSMLQSLSTLSQVSNMFSGGGSFGGSSAGSSALTSVNAANSWNLSSNTGVLNREVAKGARDKFTTIKGGGKDTVTIMVWMCGADLESRSGMATNDLKEMASATLSDNVQIIVCTGGSKSWHIQGISNTVHQLYRVRSGQLEQLNSNYGNGAMTDPENLEDFIKWCKKNYPANRNMLIFWDHGGGSLTGYGYDELNTRAGSMSLSEINSALKGANMKFDMVGFDTCLMATAENALMLSNYADYLVASEETEPGVGWYYTNWLTSLSANTSMPTIDIGKQICDDFVEVCAQTCRGQKTTLSVVDLAELSGTMQSAFVDFSKNTSELVSGKNYKVVSNARSNTREFSTNPIDQIDLVHFANNLGTKEAKNLADTLLSAIKYNRTGNMSNAYGMSIYFPYRAKASNVNTAVNIYDGIGLDDEYSECIKNFAGMSVGGQAVSGGGSVNNPYSVLSGLGASPSSSGQSGQEVLQLLNMFMGGGSSSSASANPMGAIAGQLLTGLLTDRSMPLEDTAEYIAENSFDASDLSWKLYEDMVYRLVLPQEQWDLVQGLDLNMFFDDGEGYVDLGLDNVYEFDDYGNLIGTTDGSWVSINDQPVAYYHVSTVEEEDGSYSIMGYVPAMLNGEQVKLILVFSDDVPYGYVAGAMPAYEEDETETVAKGLIEIQDGDAIDFLCDFYSYDGEYLDSYYLGDQLIVDGELTISNTLLGDGVYALYRFTDIYGQHYWTDPVPAE